MRRAAITSSEPEPLMVAAEPWLDKRAIAGRKHVWKRGREERIVPSLATMPPFLERTWEEPIRESEPAMVPPVENTN